MSVHDAPLLAFHRLRKTLPDGRRLLDVARLDIHRGACLLFTGENGAGKTTLLKILAGLEPPDAADVEYRGARRSWRQARRCFRGAVIYLHQHPYLFDASVFDNVAYGLHRAGFPPPEIGRRVAMALARAGLAHLAARNARRLSGGEQQRVALTRAWVLAPEILLLDEPTTSMDHESRERTYFLIQRLKAEGIGVVIASHELQRLGALADVHLHLHAGTLRRAAPTSSHRPQGPSTSAFGVPAPSPGGQVG